MTATTIATGHLSKIELGKLYKDERTGIEGYAKVVCFQQHGCVEAILEWVKDGEVKTELFNELRLVTPNGAPLDSEEHEYTTGLVLGEEYEDIQTGIRGHLAVVEFHEHMNNRGILRSATKNKKEVSGYKYHSIDDFLLKNLATKKVADTQEKRSPVSHETTRYR